MMTTALRAALGATLLLAGTAALAQPAPVCIPPSAGGSAANTTTCSISSSQTFVDTRSTLAVQTYSTRLLAVLDGANTVYDQTFATPIGDPTVQNAIAVAQAALTTAGAPDPVVFGAPSQTGPTTTLLTSITAAPVVTNTAVTQVATAEVTVGPGTILIGDRDAGGVQYFVLSGQVNTNINVETRTEFFRDVVTTNTFLTTVLYTLTATTQRTSGVPEPGPLALALAAFGAWGVAARRRHA